MMVVGVVGLCVLLLLWCWSFGTLIKDSSF